MICCRSSIVLGAGGTVSIACALCPRGPESGPFIPGVLDNWDLLSCAYGGAICVLFLKRSPETEGY